LKYFSFNEAVDELGMPLPLFRALLRAGLFGYTKKKRIARIALEHFNLYGSQWRDKLEPRELPDHVVQTPEVSTGNQPVGTRTHIQISTHPDGGNRLKTMPDGLHFIISAQTRFIFATLTLSR
jgi:hypothetical protein